MKPCLKVTGLHVEGLKALRRVDWPADGMGWQGKVPDLVMVGGINGSGKTTLLELIAEAASLLHAEGPLTARDDPGANAWIDVRATGALLEDTTFRAALSRSKRSAHV